MFTHYMFKNHQLLEIDPLSAYKILACNRYIFHRSEQNNTNWFTEQTIMLKKRFTEIHEPHKEMRPLEINAVLEMQMAFTECDFLAISDDADSWENSASYADLFAATRDWVITMFHIFNCDVDMR